MKKDFEFINISVDKFQEIIDYECNKAFKEGKAQGVMDGAFFMTFCFLCVLFLIMLWKGVF